jgi:hypothetical protein
LITTARATVTFDSTHRDTEREGPHLHGHTFTVTVDEVADLAGPCLTLYDDLFTVTRGLHLHTLGEMLYGGSERLDSIAAWITEQLLLAHPRITEVTVSIPGMSGVVTREIR